MKKAMFLNSFAILVIALFMSSCSKEDNPVTPDVKGFTKSVTQPNSIMPIHQENEFTYQRITKDEAGYNVISTDTIKVRQIPTDKQFFYYDYNSLVYNSLTPIDATIYRFSSTASLHGDILYDFSNANETEIDFYTNVFYNGSEQNYCRIWRIKETTVEDLIIPNIQPQYRTIFSNEQLTLKDNAYNCT